ncbi:SRPBCC family protein [Aminobacter sp. Piv2-1]|uniref:SRPBCC family protein n=1 Tax=Aminobacter sp. Piv2-1 TaxID=3031122 RepID=UPI00309D5F57
MTTTISPSPVRRSVTVKAAPQRAFKVFTAGFSSWWPKGHSIGSVPQKTATIEPRVGGRWYETGEDGSECPWGDVIAWEPPQRILLAWRIGADWKYDPKLLTEVEVHFVPLAEGGTRVELEHRLLENMGDKADETAAMLGSEGGWGGILVGFGAAADAAA